MSLPYEKPRSVGSMRPWCLPVKNPQMQIRDPVASLPGHGMRSVCSSSSQFCLQKTSDGRHMFSSHQFVLIYFKPVTMVLAQRVAYLTCILRAIGFSNWRKIFFTIQIKKLPFRVENSTLVCLLILF